MLARSLATAVLICLTACGHTHTAGCDCAFPGDDVGDSPECDGRSVKFSQEKCDELKKGAQPPITRQRVADQPPPEQQP
jgi:hypothetical protein